VKNTKIVITVLDDSANRFSIDTVIPNVDIERSIIESTNMNIGHLLVGEEIKYIIRTLKNKFQYDKES